MEQLQRGDIVYALPPSLSLFSPESLAAIKAYIKTKIGTFGHHNVLFYKRSYESNGKRGACS